MNGARGHFRGDAGAGAPGAGPREAPSRPRGRGDMNLVLAAAGFLGIVAQTLLLRELIVAGSGDETTIGIGLACWLLGIVAGTRLPAFPWPVAWAGLCSWGAAGILLLRAGRALLAPPPGELPGPAAVLLLAAAGLGPGGALVGWTFSRLAPLRGVRHLYVAESAGAALGGLAITGALLLPEAFGPAAAAGPVTLALLAGGAGMAAAALDSRNRRFAGLALLFGLAALAGPPLDSLANRARFAGIAPGFHLAASLDTPYRHLDLAGEPGAWALWSSGLYAGSFPDPDADEPFAHELACLVEKPRRVLATEAVTRGMLRFLLEHPVERVDVVVLDRAGFSFLRDRLSPPDRAALADPRVRVVFGDLRRVVARRGPYDLVLVLEPDPVTLFLARIATREFYDRACRSLAPGGVLAVRFENAPNVQDPDTAALGGSLLRTLAAACGQALAAPAPHGLLVAGPRVTLDPAVLASRYRARRVSSSRFVEATFALDWPPGRVAALTRVLRQAGAPPSTDDRPVAFLHALARRQRVSGIPGLGRWLRLAAVLLLAWALVPRPRRAALHRVATAGALGMAGSLVVLYRYQAEVGALYGRLGLLTAAFMVGLALGGAHERRWPGLARWGAAAATAVFLLPLPHALALLGAGWFLGMVFAHGARLLAGVDPDRAAAALEAADHLGAAAAAPLVSLALVPWLGARATIVLLALPALLAAAVPASRR